MNINDCSEVFNQLPVSLIYQPVDGGAVRANTTCFKLFGATPDNTQFEASIALLDPESGRPLAEDHFLKLAQEPQDEVLVRIVTCARSLTCSVSAKHVMIGDEPVLIICVDNGHDNEISDRYFRHSPLANHLEFTRLLSSISSKLINASDAMIDELIEQSLGAFGQFCSVDRCYLFRYTDGGKMMNNTHEWVAAGVSPYKDHLQGVSNQDLPYFSEVLTKQHVFKVDDVDLLPESARAEKQEFTRERIRAVLCVAIHIHDKLVGFIGCDVIGGVYHWREHDIRYLRLVGEMVSNALEHIENRRSIAKVTRQLEKANKRLAHLANSDGLTGIANRRQFDDSLQKAIRRGTRHCSSVSLLMIDVDYFKQYNDQYGHAAGDAVLKKIARELQRCCQRADDLAARYGGEEFAVVLPDTDYDQALVMAEKIRKAVFDLAIPFAFSESGVLSVSIGVATERCDSVSQSEKLIKRADKALYNAKDNGRDQIIGHADWFNESEKPS